MNLRLPLVGAVLLLAAGPADAQTASLGYNFQTIQSSESGFIPPDTNGAVGPNHVVMHANGRAKMFNKAGTQLNTQSLFSFWQTRAGQAGTIDEFDPRVVYDRHSGRWFVAANDSSDENSATLIAVSPGSDPTAASWFGTRIDMDSTGTRWGDFNQLAVGPTWVAVTNNMFPVNTGSQQVSLITIPKASMLAGTTTGLSYKPNLSIGTYGFTPHPVTDYFAGSAATQYTLSRDTSTGLQLSTIAGPTNNPLYTAFGSLISVASNSSPPDAPQSGTTTLVATNDTRFSAQPVLVNGKLWAAHAISSGGVASIRWYRINPSSNTLEAQGTLPAPAGLHLYFPSIAVNQQGDIVIGYSGSSSSTFPSSYYTVGRYDGTTTTFGNPVLTQAGASAITNGRFGDYGSTNIDPADLGVFWTFQEYAGPSGSWRTRATEVIPTRANEVRWQTAAAGLLSDNTKWFTGAAPGAADHVIFSRWSTSNYAIDATGGATNDRLSIRQTGNGTVTLNIPAGATWELTNTSDTSRSFTVSEFQGQSNVVVSGGGTLSTRHALIAGEAVGTATVTVTGAGTVWNNANDLSIGGTATTPGGTGRLNVQSGASVVVGGALGLYQGDGSAIQVQVGTAAAPATLNANSVVGGTGLTPRIDLAHAGSVLTVTDGAGATFAGVVTGPGQLVKQGAGSFTLTGANTHTGATTVSGGTLALSGSGSIATSPTLTVASGATLGVSGVTGGANFDATTAQFAPASGQTLQGTGTVNSGVTVRQGAGIRGDAGTGTGTLTVSGTVVVVGAAGGGGTLTSVISDNGTFSPDDSALAATTLNLVIDGTNKLNLVVLGGVNALPFVVDQYTAVLATAGVIQINGVTAAPNTVLDPSTYILFAQGIYVGPGEQLAVDGTGQALVLTFSPVPEPGLVIALSAGVLGMWRLRSGGVVRSR